MCEQLCIFFVAKQNIFEVVKDYMIHLETALHIELHVSTGALEGMVFAPNTFGQKVTSHDNHNDT